MSLRFQADNDLRFAIVKAVRRLEPAIDFGCAQEAGLNGLGDSELLDRTAAEGRVLVSHDRRTMLNHFRNHFPHPTNHLTIPPTPSNICPRMVVVLEGEVLRPLD